MISLIDVTVENCPNYLDRIIGIENQSFPSPWSLRAFREEIKNPSAYVWALAVNEFLSGYICFRMMVNDIQLTNIAVHPKERGKGIAHHLLTKTIEAGINKGEQSIWLEVRPSNFAAKRLYQKLGFEEAGRRPRYYRDTNEDAIVMALALSEMQRYHVASI